MKDQSKGNYVKLGLFVILSLSLVITALYLIGKKSNLFGRSLTVYAMFKNVNGLMTGNNVRFAGIDIGTVKRVTILNDTSILVSLTIEKDAQRYLRKNSRADIGSDGLMGNKLINILTSPEPSDQINEGDTIQSLRPLAADEMMRTLSTTNDNIYHITNDLRKITRKVYDSNSLWSLLTDTASIDQIRASILNLEQTTNNTRLFSEDLEAVMSGVQNGQGPVGLLMTDEAAEEDLRATIASIRSASDSAELAVIKLNEFMDMLNFPRGPISTMAKDTLMANDMKAVLNNLKRTSELLNENLIAMRSNFLFKKYYKQQAKEEKKKSK